MWRQRCQLCLRSAETALCDNCWQQIEPLEAGARSFLLAPGLPHIAYAAYVNPLKQMLFTVKYHPARELAYGLGWQLGLWYRAHWPLPDLIVPVPLHAERQAERGYNQAEELGRGLSAALGRPCRALLSRVRATPRLYELGPEARREVLAGAFEPLPACRRHAPGKRLLLLDDILTTGSTLLGAAECLQAHDSRLISLSLARALIHHDKEAQPDKA